MNCGHDGTVHAAGADAAEAFVRENGLLAPASDWLVRIPHLERGRLVLPGLVPRRRIEDALGDGEYAEVDGVQAVRIRTGPPDLIHVLPTIADPRQLAVQDPALLARDLYGLPSRDALEYVERVGRVLSASDTLARAVTSGALLASGTQLAAARSAITVMMKGKRLEGWVDRELAWGSIPGIRLLDGWQVVSPAPPSLGRCLADLVGSRPAPGPEATVRRLRAVPTRQLHIAAGNTQTGALMSAVRALSVKGATILKLASGGLVGGGALAVAMAFAAPVHPMLRFQSVVYWRGGDRRVEDLLLGPALVERVMVSGDANTVARVRSRAAGVKIVAQPPRLGISLIGREAQASLRHVTHRAVGDSLIAGQAACDASLVHIVEGSSEEVLVYAGQLAATLSEWDTLLPHAAFPAELGRLREARRGLWLGARWFLNGPPDAPTSAVACVFGTPRVWSPPMARAVLVCGVASLEEALPRLPAGTGIVSVYPEARRLVLCDELVSRGVVSVAPLGASAAMDTAMPRDGMRLLSELVAWAVS